MLRKRYKRRYLAIIYKTLDCRFDQRVMFNLIIKRNSELFGHIFTQISYIRLIKQDHDNLMIISCKAETIDQVLISITLATPSLVVIDISGSIRKLIRRVSNKLSFVPQ
jgi:RNase P/RNase MRP subunit POP5